MLERLEEEDCSARSYVREHARPSGTDTHPLFTTQERDEEDTCPQGGAGCRSGCARRSCRARGIESTTSELNKITTDPPQGRRFLQRSYTHVHSFPPGQAGLSLFSCAAVVLSTPRATARGSHSCIRPVVAGVF